MTPPRGHAEPQELVAYHAGEMAEEDAERLRDHLALCSECSELLLDLLHFDELEVPDGVEEPSAAEIEAAVARLRGRVGEGKEMSAQIEAPSRLLPFPAELREGEEVRAVTWRRLLPVALAAGFAGLLMGWSLRPVPGETEILSQLGSIDVFTGDSVNRGEKTKRGIVVVNIPLPPDAPYATYTAEVYPSPSGPLRLRFDRLYPNNERQLTLAFGRDFPGGDYRIKVFGVADGRRVPLRLVPESFSLDP